MKNRVKIFAELKQAREAARAYEQGKPWALRVTELPPRPKALRPHEIRAIRRSYGMSQAAFARLFNVSPNTVESWEQGVRRPREATLKLLVIAQKHPEVLLAAG